MTPCPSRCESGQGRASTGGTWNSPISRITASSTSRTTGPSARKTRFLSAACTSSGLRSEGSTPPLSRGKTFLGSDRTGPASRQLRVDLRPQPACPASVTFRVCRGCPQLPALRVSGQRRRRTRIARHGGRRRRPRPSGPETSSLPKARLRTPRPVCPAGRALQGAAPEPGESCMRKMQDSRWVARQRVGHARIREEAGPSDRSLTARDGRRRGRSRSWRNSGLSRSWPRDLSPHESGAAIRRARTRWLVHAAEEKRVFRADRHDDRRVDESAGLAVGEEQVPPGPTSETCFVVIAVRSSDGDDASQIVSPEGDIHLSQVGPGVLVVSGPRQPRRTLGRPHPKPGAPRGATSAWNPWSPTTLGPWAGHRGRGC